MAIEFPDLRLAVKREYFEQIKAGVKTEEYRAYSDYWYRRLVDRDFRNVIITLGYPASNDVERTLVFPWRGQVEKEITHKHFGDKPVFVFAIKLEQPQ